MSVPLEEQMSCVRRELSLRHAVYPGLVARGRQTQDWADYQIRAMTAVLRTLEDLWDRQGGKEVPTAYTTETE